VAWPGARYVTSGAGAWRNLVQTTTTQRAVAQTLAVKRANARVGAAASMWHRATLVNNDNNNNNNGGKSELREPVMTAPESVQRRGVQSKQRRRLLADGRAALALYACVVRAVALAVDSEFARRARRNDRASSDAGSVPFIGLHIYVVVVDWLVVDFVVAVFVGALLVHADEKLAATASNTLQRIVQTTPRVRADVLDAFVALSKQNSDHSTTTKHKTSLDSAVLVADYDPNETHGIATLLQHASALLDLWADRLVARAERRANDDNDAHDDYNNDDNNDDDVVLSSVYDNHNNNNNNNNVRRQPPAVHRAAIVSPVDGVADVVARNDDAMQSAESSDDDDNEAKTRNNVDVEQQQQQQQQPTRNNDDNDNIDDDNDEQSLPVSLLIQIDALAMIHLNSIDFRVRIGKMHN
jgi:hypothetical protein